MVFVIQETMILDYLDIQIPIGPEVSQTERAPQADVSVLGPRCDRGLVGTNLVFLSVLHKLIILQLAQPVVKPYGFESCYQVYLDLS